MKQRIVLFLLTGVLLAAPSVFAALPECVEDGAPCVLGGTSCCGATSSCEGDFPNTVCKAAEVVVSNTMD